MKCRITKKNCVLSDDDWDWAFAGDFAKTECDYYEQDHRDHTLVDTSRGKALFISDFCEHLKDIANA